MRKEKAVVANERAHLSNTARTIYISTNNVIV